TPVSHAMDAWSSLCPPCTSISSSTTTIHNENRLLICNDVTRSIESGSTTVSASWIGLNCRRNSNRSPLSKRTSCSSHSLTSPLATSAYKSASPSLAPMCPPFHQRDSHGERAQHRRANHGRGTIQSL